VCGKNALSYSGKNQLDLFYIRHRSLFLDFMIITETVPAIIQGIGFREKK